MVIVFALGLSLGVGSLSIVSAVGNAGLFVWFHCSMSPLAVVMQRVFLGLAYCHKAEHSLAGVGRGGQFRGVLVAIDALVAHQT
jgi:hypothetical protein